jgi:GrpB-like predicted nucleotidyltransferase (UPF0157 family)
VETREALDRRLRAAGVAPDADPVEAWRRLRSREGPAATIIDLYELAARGRGLSAGDLACAERHALARLVMPDIWPDWELTSGSQRVGDVITIADYGPSWPDRYAAWHDKLRAALGATAVRIEHVGSTSVPGLPAKPIVDVQVSVADVADETAYVALLEGIGLQLRSRDVFHRYFRPFPGRPRDVHVHVCGVGSQWEAEHLHFRDYLCTHPAARDQYARVKRDAAARWADDGLAYTDAKTEVILDILSQAAPG